MSLKFLVYVGIIYAVAYPFAARVWRNLRRPLEALSEQERRLVPLWRRQAIGIGVATVTLAAGVVLFAAPVAPYIPFWSIYAWVTLVGVGALITVHAKALESRISAPIAKRLPVTASARYDIAWKVALVSGLTQWPGMPCSSPKPLNCSCTVVPRYGALSAARMLSALGAKLSCNGGSMVTPAAPKYWFSPSRTIIGSRLEPSASMLFDICYHQPKHSRSWSFSRASGLDHCCPAFCFRFVSDVPEFSNSRRVFET